MQQACRLLLEYYPILTTVFGEESGVPYQMEQPSQCLPSYRRISPRLHPGRFAPSPRQGQRTLRTRSGTLNPVSAVHSRHSGRHRTSAPHHRAPHYLDGASVVPLVTALFDAYRDLIIGRQPEPERSISSALLLRLCCLGTAPAGQRARRATSRLLVAGSWPNLCQCWICR